MIHSIVENSRRPSARTIEEKPVDRTAPAMRTCAYGRAYGSISAVAPTSRSSGSSAARPITELARAVPQKIVNEVPAARAAASGLPAPRRRETREAPPTPTVVDTAPSRSRSGATTLTAASAVSPTPRATNQAFVRA